MSQFFLQTKLKTNPLQNKQKFQTKIEGNIKSKPCDIGSVGFPNSCTDLSPKQQFPFEQCFSPNRH